MKFSFYTLGCKVNQYETQAMQQMLLSHGHTLGEFDEPCDGYIVNSCTVTAVSDKKTRNAIRRAQKLNPNAAVGVCGCYAQSAPEEVRALGVDVMVGTADREAFVLQMEQAAQDKSRLVHWEKVEPSGLPRAFEQLPAGGLAARTRALLKIEDGCNNFCTYCIIPYARGRVRSMPLEAAVEETKRLAREGYREIVINGIEISSWGWEWKDGSRLPQLLLAVCQAAPDVRIRLGSLEPRTIDEEFCTMLSGCKNLCPQFHLSLQSGSDTVLKRMNRKYDTTRYLESVRLLHEYFPNCAVTTDLIVGFPGETEEDFQQTMDVVRQARFSSAFTFIYSPRPGTPAAAMEQIPRDVVQDRFDRLVALQEQITEENLATFEGRDVEVMITGKLGKKDIDTHRVTGREKTGVLVHIGVPEGEPVPEIGDFVTVTVTHAGRHNLLADPDVAAGQTYSVRH